MVFDGMQLVAGVPGARPLTWPRASIAHSGAGRGCVAAPENRGRRLDTEAARRQDDAPIWVTTLPPGSPSAIAPTT